MIAKARAKRNKRLKNMTLKELSALKRIVDSEIKNKRSPLTGENKNGKR